MNRWIAQQVKLLRALSGRTAIRWIAIEMAVSEGADGVPQWYDASIPYLQLSRLDLVLADGAVAPLVTYQNSDQFGLCRDDGLAPLDSVESDLDPIFRLRSAEELPTGEIGPVTVLMDDAGDISEVRFTIRGHDMSLRAGEVYPQLDGSLNISYMDESILVQVDGRMPK